MCGRYTLSTTADELALLFDISELPMVMPRYNMAPTQQAAVVREITKLHEEFLRGRISEVIAEVGPREIRGEVTLIIEGSSDVDPPSEEGLREEIAELIAGGLRIKEIAEVLGEKYGYSKRQIYGLAMDQGRPR